MLWRVPQIAAVHPHKILLSMRQNDLHDLSLDEIKKKNVVLIDAIENDNPQVTFYLESLTLLDECQFKRVCDNKEIKEINGVIRKDATKRDLQCVDIYSIYGQDGQMPMTLSTDGQHLKPEARERWAKVLRSFIYEN